MLKITDDDRTELVGRVICVLLEASGKSRDTIIGIDDPMMKASERIVYAVLNKLDIGTVKGN